MKPKGSLPSRQEPATEIWAMINSVQITTPYFFKVHFNYILPFVHRYPKWSLSFRFSKFHMKASA